MTEAESVTREKAIVPKSVAIAMAVSVSLPLLIGTFGILLSLNHDSSPETLSLCMTCLQNGFALFACIMTLRKTKRYWLSVTAGVLTFLAWFWLAFSSCPMVLVVLGMAVSVPVGMWSLAVIRKPDIRAAFGSQLDPVESVATFVLPRIPRFKIEPTPGNISRASIVTLLGVCVFGILLGAIFGTPTDAWSRKLKEKNAAQYAATVDAMRNADKTWASGNKEEAVEAYQRVLDSDMGTDFLSKNGSDISKAYCRIIDSQVERGGPEAGREMIRRALREPVAKVTLSLASPGANMIVTEERKIVEAEKEKAYVAQQRAEKDRIRQRVENSSSTGGNGEDDGPWLSGKSGVAESSRTTRGNSGTQASDAGDSGIQVNDNTALRAAQARDAKLKELTSQMESGDGMKRGEFQRRQMQIMREYQQDLQKVQRREGGSRSDGANDNGTDKLDRVWNGGRAASDEEKQDQQAALKFTLAPGTMDRQDVKDAFQQMKHTGDEIEQDRKAGRINQEEADRRQRETGEQLRKDLLRIKEQSQGDGANSRSNGGEKSGADKLDHIWNGGGGEMDKVWGK